MLTGKLFCWEGCTDTNAYWEALLLRKATQTPMPTGKLFCWGRLHRHQFLLEALCWGRLDWHQCLLGSSSAEEGCTDTNAYWEALLLIKAAQTPMLTGKLFCWGRLDWQCLQCLLGSSSAEGWKAAQTPMLTGKLFCWGRLHRYQCLLRKAAQTPMLAEEGWTDTNAYWEALCWGRLDWHQCWEALLLTKAAQTQTPRLHRHQCLLGSSSAEEGWTDTNAYWEALLLRRLHRHQCLLGSSSCYTDTKLGSSSAEEGYTDTNSYWKLSAEEGCTDTNAYWEALLLHRHQCLLGSSLDTNAYWEALLLTKAAQTPMLTGKHFCWGMLHRHQCLLWEFLLFEQKRHSTMDFLL